jgi:mRNA-degrading endonuclease toxin of MazEF toxin-antitoxin module
MTRRGDVVMVDFPFMDTGQAKTRPAVVVQNDRDNQKIRKTVVAMVTGNLRRQGDPSHLYVDPADPLLPRASAFPRSCPATTSLRSNRRPSLG